VPITLSGEIVSWTTRSLHNKGVRYLNARPEEESVSAKDVLFGEEFCGHAVVVVEGSFDAMTIGPGAVAVMGLKVSARQFERICSFPLRVIAFDSEREAQRRASKLSQELKLFPGETYLVELSGKDAASSPKHEIEELRRRFLK
jgi:DNA primase